MLASECTGIKASETKMALIKILERRNVSNPQYKNLIAIIKENLKVQKTSTVYSFPEYKLPSVILGDNTTLDLNSIYNEAELSIAFDPVEHALWMRNYQEWL